MLFWKTLPKRKKSTVDVFVTMELNDSRVLRTAVIRDDNNPFWDERFIFDVAHETKEICFYVNDEEEPGSVPSYHRIGVTKLPVSKLTLANNVLEGWFPILAAGTRVVGGQLFLKLEYTPAKVAALSDAVCSPCFEMKSANNVTLYQDACCGDDDIFGKIVLSNGRRYVPGSLWKDVDVALRNAKKFIYLCDWQFSPNVRLVRDTSGGETVGELLKRKAEEGVTVLLLAGDYQNSDLNLDAEQYFRGSRVVVERMLRKKQNFDFAGNKTHVSLSEFTHHQNSIVADAEISGSSKRSIVAFLGDMDMVYGRYDSHQHPLFVQGKQEYANDFYQDSADVHRGYGPRLPWHDVHSRLVGPAAHDVLKNFEERWTKQITERLKLLVNVNTSEFKVEKPEQQTVPEEYQWQVQILRSINSDSLIVNSECAERMSSKRGRKTEATISRGHSLLVRKAEKFIYIENHHFMGSSYAWLEQNKTDKCRHVLPMEIVSKIGEKIKAGQRFAAYIVIPMRPNGKPDDPICADMLLNQRLTIQMMYKKVAGFIKAAGTKALPTDYLNFYFLGKRELKEDGRAPPNSSQKTSATAENLTKTRRFMIHVNSKTIIVDDSYIIVGSASANQKSMGGNRDTDLAMMAYQSSYKYKEGSLPRGQVHGFRMGLWAEHTNKVIDEYLDPSSVECVQKINSQAEDNLLKYCQNELCALNGYLIKYPIEVKANGDVIARPKLANFPDSDLPVLGSTVRELPLKLST